MQGNLDAIPTLAEHLDLLVVLHARIPIFNHLKLSYHPY